MARQEELHPEAKRMADYLASVMRTSSAARLVPREVEEYVTLTNRRTHVIALNGDSHGEEPIYLLPGVPNDKVPSHFLEHEDVALLIENGGITEGTRGANKAAVKEVEDIDFANPQGSKEKRLARAKKGKAGAKAAEGSKEGGDGDAGAGDGASGDGLKPWEAQQ